MPVARRRAIVKVPLFYAYEIPAYTRSLNNRAFVSDNTEDPLIASTFRTDTSGSYCVQAVISACRSTGLVEILKAENAAATGDATTVYGGVGGKALGGPDFSISGRFKWYQINVPEAPAQYDPEVAGFTWSSSTPVRQCAGPMIAGAAVGYAASPRIFPSFMVEDDQQAVPNAAQPAQYNRFDDFYTGLSLWSGIRAWNAYDTMTPGGMNYMLFPANLYHGVQVAAWLPSPNVGVPPDPAPKTVTLDDAVLNAIFIDDAPIPRFASYGRGFIAVLYTNGAGPTGQFCEVLVFNPSMTEYFLCEFDAQDSETQQALATNDNTAAWSVAVDKHGVVFLKNMKNLVTTQNRVFTSYSPLNWTLPTIEYTPRSSIALPCFTPCLSTGV